MGVKSDGHKRTRIWCICPGCLGTRGDKKSSENMTGTSLTSVNDMFVFSILDVVFCPTSNYGSEMLRLHKNLMIFTNHHNYAYVTILRFRIWQKELWKAIKGKNEDSGVVKMISTKHEAVFSVVFISVRQNNFKSPYSTQALSLSAEKFNILRTSSSEHYFNGRYTRCYLYFFDIFRK